MVGYVCSIGSEFPTQLIQRPRFRSAMNRPHIKKNPLGCSLSSRIFCFYMVVGGGEESWASNASNQHRCLTNWHHTTPNKTRKIWSCIVNRRAPCRVCSSQRWDLDSEPCLVCNSLSVYIKIDQAIGWKIQRIPYCIFAIELLTDVCELLTLPMDI